MFGAISKSSQWPFEMDNSNFEEAKVNPKGQVLNLWVTCPFEPEPHNKNAIPL